MFFRFAAETSSEEVVANGVEASERCASVEAEEMSAAPATADTTQDSEADDARVSPYYPLSPQPPSANGDVANGSDDLDSSDSVLTLPAVRSANAQVPTDGPGRAQLLRAVNQSQTAFQKSLGDQIRSSSSSILEHKDEFSRAFKKKLVGKLQRRKQPLPTIG